MTENDHTNDGIDAQTPDADKQASNTTGLPLNRRSALKGGAAGLAALGFSSFAANAAAHHKDGHGDDSGGGGSAANQFRFAGEEWHIMSAASETDQQTTEVKTFMRVNGVKQSNSWQDSLVFQPSVESSLLTDVKVSGDSGSSKAIAGVLGWIEIKPSSGGADDWQMVTVDDELVAPPTEDNITAAGAYEGDRINELARGIVAFNSRDLKLEWDLESLVEAALAEVESVIETLQENYTWSEYQDVVASHSSYNEHETWLASHEGISSSDAEVFVTTAENEIGTWSEYQTFVANASSYDELKSELLNLDIFTAIYLETKSANSFNFVKTGTGGTHDVRLRGALHCFVDPDDDTEAYAKAIVGNRTMLVEPTKIKARVSSRDDPSS